MKGIESQAKILKAEGVQFVTVFPDTPLSEALSQQEIRPVMPRTERLVVNIADGYSRVSNGRRIGVCSVQRDAGILNSMSGVSQAYADSSPILVLSGGTEKRDYRTHPMVDIPSMFRPVTKWIDTAWSAKQIPELMRRAFTYLRCGRTGPVLLDLPDDVAREETPEPDFHYVPVKSWRMGPDPRDIDVVVRAIMEAKNPVILAGQGVLYAEAWNELQSLAELLDLPVATTLLGKSAFPEDHPLALGLAMRMRTKMVSHFFAQADLIFAVGASLTEYFLSYPIEDKPGRKIIQLTNNEYDINKHHVVDYAILSDAKPALEAMIEKANNKGNIKKRGNVTDDIQRLKKEWMNEWKLKLESNETPINHYRVLWDMMHTIDRANSIITADSGTTRNTFGTFWETTVPRGYLGWGNSTPMGASLGLAMGAKLAAPEKLVVNVTGDGAFGMVGMDFETSVREKIPILTVLCNNSLLSSIRSYPSAHEHYSVGRLSGNYADLAESLGGYSERVTNPDEIVPSIRRAVKSVQSGKSALLEFITKLETADSRP